MWKKVLKNMNNYEPLRLEIINDKNQIERFNFR